MDKAFNPISHGNPVLRLELMRRKRVGVRTLMVISPKARGLVQKANCTSMS